MQKNPNWWCLTAMFIALLMVAALGPTKASVDNSGYPAVEYAFDVGPPGSDIATVSSTPYEFQIMIVRGVAVPVIELITESKTQCANYITYYENQKIFYSPIRSELY